MIKNSTVDSINRRLRIHGSNEYGDPNFRVVFSDDQLESRKGIFNDFYGELFLRQEIGVRQVHTYPNIKSKWILERWASGELAHHEDLVTMKNGVYICVYVFQDANKNYLPPLQKVCDIIVKQLLHPRPKAQAMAEDFALDQIQEEKEFDLALKDIQEEHEASLIKDPKSIRESLSTGYGEKNRRIR